MKQSEYHDLLETDKSKAQRVLFDEYLNYVYTIAFNRLRSCGSLEDVDECVSDIFKDVFDSYEYKPNQHDDIKGFIATVALRKSAAYYHKLCKNKNSISLDDENSNSFPSNENISESAEKEEIRQTLLKLIDSLGEPDSTIIIQKYYYNRSSDDIAEMVDMKPAAVRKRVSRAVKKLREMLTAIGEGR